MARKAKSRSKSKAKTKTKAKARVAPIAKGFHTVTPYLAQHDCAAAVAFYIAAFGAKQRYALTEPDGRIAHTELTIGDSIVMMAQESPKSGAVSPKTVGASPVRLHLSVKNVDAFVAKAVDAGAILTRPVADQFYGERSGMVTDPFGYSWMVGTQVEAVTPKQMQKRWTAIMTPKET